MNAIAKKKIGQLSDSGQKQVAVVMSGILGCAVVSEQGRVTWQDEDFVEKALGGVPATEESYWTAMSLREKQFRTELRDLLERHNAELEIIEHGDDGSLFSIDARVTATLGEEYDDNGQRTKDLLMIDLGEIVLTDLVFP